MLPAAARLHQRDDKNEARKSAAVALLLSMATASAALAGSASGSSALALAALVARCSPDLSAADKKTVATLFAGSTGVAGAKKISVTADKLMCRTSNVDLTSRSCEITYKGGKKTMKGREANELFATAALAGIAPEGAAGSNIESADECVARGLVRHADNANTRNSTCGRNPQGVSANGRKPWRKRTESVDSRKRNHGEELGTARRAADFWAAPHSPPWAPSPAICCRLRMRPMRRPPHRPRPPHQGAAISEIPRQERQARPARRQAAGRRDAGEPAR